MKAWIPDATEVKLKGEEEFYLNNPGAFKRDFGCWMGKKMPSTHFWHLNNSSRSRCSLINHFYIFYDFWNNNPINESRFNLD